MTRGLLAGAALALLAAAGCTQSSPPPPGSQGGQQGGRGADVARGRPASVTWHACSNRSRTLCGRLRVPLDYAHPGGRSITLALTEVPATAPRGQRQGILLVNPGGPGASGRPWASYVAHGLV